MPLKTSFEASRYVHHTLFLSKEELLEVAPTGVYVILGKVKENPIISREEFLQMAEGGRMQALGFAFEESSFDFLKIPNRGFIARQNKPVIEIKPFAFMLSSENQLLENVFGKDSIDFGIDFSYPMLFRSNGEVIKTKGLFKEGEEFDKIKVFKRKDTIPAQFMLNKERLNGSFRIGKRAVIKAKEILSSITGLSLRGVND